MFIFKRRKPRILYDHTLSRNENFLQYLALGTVFSKDKANDTLEFLLQCRRQWKNLNKDSDWLNLDKSEKLLFIDSLFNKINRDFINALPNETLVMGFSSGLDSRLAFHKLHSANIKVIPYTFGQEGEYDFDLSQIISTQSGINTRFVDISKIEWPLEWYDKYMCQVSDTVLSPRYITSKILLEETGPHYDIHGYFNDALVGKPFRNIVSDNWKKTKKYNTTRYNTFNIQKFINPRSISDYLPDKPITEHNNIRYLHQINLAFQEQRIRPRDHADVKYLFPFFDWRWIGFWLSRSDEELINQSLYREYIDSLRSDIIFDNKNYISHYQKNQKNRIFKTDKTIPGNPGVHFCIFACYKNNPSFRKFIDRVIDRAIKRKIFNHGFIDKARVNFLKNDRIATGWLKGIVSADIAIESGVFN